MGRRWNLELMVHLIFNYVRSKKSQNEDATAEDVLLKTKGLQDDVCKNKDNGRYQI